MDYILNKEICGQSIEILDHWGLRVSDKEQTFTSYEGDMIGVYKIADEYRSLLFQGKDSIYGGLTKDIHVRVFYPNLSEGRALRIRVTGTCIEAGKCGKYHNIKDKQFKPFPGWLFFRNNYTRQEAVEVALAYVCQKFRERKITEKPL